MGEELLNQGTEGIEGAGASTAEDQEGAQGNHEGQQSEPEKKYTDAEVDRIIAKKIAAELQRMQKLFTEEQQVSELETREREVLKRELKADAMDALIADGMPSSLATLMDYSSKEDFEKSYAEVTDVFRRALGAEFKRQLAGPAPRVGINDSSSKGAMKERAIKNAFAPKALR